MEDIVFLFFKDSNMESIIEYLTDVQLMSQATAKKEGQSIHQTIETIKGKGYQLEYNPFWNAYQVHHPEIGLRVFDCRDAKTAVDLALRG